MSCVDVAKYIISLKAKSPAMKTHNLSVERIQVLVSEYGDTPATHVSIIRD